MVVDVEDNFDSTQKFDAKKLASLPMIEENGVTLPNGTHIGNFTIEKVLGIGGFGIVYLATQDVVGRKVAIKEFFPSVMVDRLEGQTVKLRTTSDMSLFDSGMSSFVKEATILSSLNHPSLVQVLHFWQENGTAYMVMPYYEGQSLAEKIKDKTFIASTDCINRILEGLLPALEYLHQQNIYHRDISPENIFLLKNDNPLLLDFGAARQIVEEGMNVTAMLKPSYAPIEQYDKNAKQGAYTDIYALCATLYHLITKKQPQASVTRNLNNYLSVLASDELLVAQYPLGLLKAIDAGLEIMPDARPQTIADWRKILQEPELKVEAITSEENTTQSIVNQSAIEPIQEQNIAVMNSVQKKTNKTGILLLLAGITIGISIFAYLSWGQKSTGLNNITMDVAVYEQAMQEYETVNNLVSGIALNRVKSDLATLDKQIKSFTPPQVAFELKKKKIILEHDKELLEEVKNAFLKENGHIWEKTAQQVKIMMELKQSNKLVDLNDLLVVVKPNISDMNTKLTSYQDAILTKQQKLIQKINGTWALSACDKDASSWQVKNNIIFVTVDNKQLAAEDIVTIADDRIVTTTQNIKSYPKNTNELFFEYHVTDSVLEIKHLSDKQKLKRCL